MSFQLLKQKQQKYESCESGASWKPGLGCVRQSQPGPAEHTHLLLLAQSWHISPLTQTLWGPVTLAIVWLRSVPARAPAPNKAMSWTPTRLPQSLPPTACLGWYKVARQTGHNSPNDHQLPERPWRGMKSWPHASEEQGLSTIYYAKNQMCEVYC